MAECRYHCRGADCLRRGVLWLCCRLMTAWCVVVDVWFMDPQTIGPGEDAVAFAERVQKMIAKRAGLEAVQWDGYLKYWKPSDRFIQVRACTSCD
jgi:hypothetical protein